MNISKTTVINGTPHNVESQTSHWTKKRGHNKKQYPKANLVKWRRSYKQKSTWVFVLMWPCLTEEN